jgi:hypothetical protein
MVMGKVSHPQPTPQEVREHEVKIAVALARFRAWCRERGLEAAA